MASKTLTLVGVILTFCVLFYAILWINLSVNLKSFSQGLKDLVRAEFLWREIHQHIDDRATINKPIITSALNFSSLEDAIDPKKQSVEREDDITPIPILYKKNFTKLPVWDFEDVYLQDHDARKPICSDSKSIHNTMDPNFKKGFLPNIQLWLYRGQLNITEWNRLAHFNNPFGFMEYKYDEIKPAVNLIPKPKLKLLPVPESAKDGCIRCAVVGSSGILNNSKLGKEIDSHDYVFRVNGALTHGYEEDVGNKTSVYVHTAFSLHSSLNAFKKTGFQRILQNENTKYVMIPEGLRDFQWLQGLLQGIEATGHYKGVRPLDYFNGTFNESRFYVLHPDFLRYVRYRFMLSEQTHTKHWAIYRPTNGAFALFLALHTCDIVDVYGYITEDHQKYSNYYYEKLKSRVIFYINHDYPLEIKTWKNLHDSGIIQLYQGKGDLNNTKT